MIDKVHIQALKSIKDMTVECSRMNLFVGTNSSGKSTFLQAILLAAQNGAEKMGLNGRLLSLGEYREVRNYYVANLPIEVDIWKDGKKKPYSIKFVENKGENSYTIITSSDEGDDQSDPLSCDDGFHYISCHRIGVKDIYNKNIVNDVKNSKDFGVDGEYALSYLLKNENNPIDDALVASDEKWTNSLLEQVNYWLHDIVDMTLSVSDIKKTNYLQVKYNNNPANISSEAMYARPVNVGSGVSYLISVLIACLASEKNDIIIIENPEIHLHPKAQSRLCRFLYFICTKERQLFIETHSDHIFNGIRVGIADETIKQKDVCVNFFALNNYETSCNPIKFGQYGKIIGTNEHMDINDLFDQFEIDLEKMLGM